MYSAAPTPRAGPWTNGGSIVVAGTNASDHETAVARLRPDGRLSAGFGGDGMVTVAAPENGSLRALAVDVDARGRVVTAGNEFVAARFAPDGTPDAGFGAGGVVGVDAMIASSVDLLRGGRIVSIGDDLVPGMVVRRLLPDGASDPSFGQGGLSRIPAAACACDPRAGTVHRGRAVVAAEAQYGEGAGEKFGFGIARMTRSGRLDASFGTGGVTITPFAAYDVEPSDVAVGAGDRIVAVGPSGFQSFMVVRYLWR